jgi:hypothetical protein
VDVLHQCDNKEKRRRNLQHKKDKDIQLLNHHHQVQNHHFHQETDLKQEQKQIIITKISIK